MERTEPSPPTCRAGDASPRAGLDGRGGAGMRRWAWVLAPGLALAVAGGCGDVGRTAAPTKPFPCRVAQSEAALIASGLVDPTVTVTDPHAIALDPPVYAYTLVVAARVGGEVGAWAMGSHATGARVFALDDTARRTTTWGAAVAPGSPPDEQRQKVVARPEVAAARRCVPGGPI